MSAFEPDDDDGTSSRDSDGTIVSGRADALAFELEMIDVELDRLWRVMLGTTPKPRGRRRQLARLWAVALGVDWSDAHPPKRLSLGLVRDEELHDI